MPRAPERQVEQGYVSFNPLVGVAWGGTLQLQPSDKNKRRFEMKGDTPPRLGDYEIHRAWEGFSSIRQISSGEIMHSRTDPIREARELYVEQAGLAERLSKSQVEE